MPKDKKDNSGKIHVSGRVDACGCLSAHDCKLIGAHSDKRTVRKKEAIYSQGDADNNIYMLCSGVVKLTRVTSGGNRLITDIVGQKTIFGGISNSDGHRRSESAIAMEDGVLHVVKKEGLSRLEKKSPKLAVKMKDLMESRRRKVEDRVVDLLFRPVEQRFAKMLLSLIDDFGSPYKGGYLLDLPVTHQVYADLIASTRETVTTVLNRFRKNGIVDYKGRNIVVLSTEKLDEITW